MEKEFKITYYRRRTVGTKLFHILCKACFFLINLIPQQRRILAKHRQEIERMAQQAAEQAKRSPASGRAFFNQILQGVRFFEVDTKDFVLQKEQETFS